MTVNSGTWPVASRVPIRAHEHVAGEEAVPGVFRDDPDRDAVFGVGSGEAILYVDVSSCRWARTFSRSLSKLAARTSGSPYPTRRVSLTRPHAR